MQQKNLHCYPSV